MNAAPSPVTLLHWHVEPALVGGILFVGWCYALLVGLFREQYAPGSPFPKRECIFFALALISFYLAVGSPLDPLGENYLFFAHMIQHNILMYVSPLLLMLGIPGYLWDELFRRRPDVEFLCRILFHPITAGLSFTLVFSFWHVGAFYEAAIQNKTLHAAEHLSMFLTSYAMWWPIASPSTRVPPIRFGPQMLYILALMLGQTPIFAFLTFSEEVFYDTYFYAERIMSLSPLEDQKAGGVLMKITNMAVSVGVLASIFFRWSKRGVSTISS